MSHSDTTPRWTWESDGGDTHDRSYPRTFYAFVPYSDERVDCRSRKQAEAVAMFKNGLEASMTGAQIRDAKAAIAANL